jgi:hypothetical protein
LSDGKRPKFTFELDAQLRTAAELAATAESMSLSAWVREAMVEKLERLIDEINETATEPVAETPTAEDSRPDPVDDMLPEPEEMSDWNVVERRLEVNDGREAAVGRARILHGAGLLCTKTADCRAQIHFPGCPRSPLKAIG